MSTTALVAIYAFITALATGIGALPFFFTRNLGRTWLGIGTAIASGSMIGASFLLVLSGWRINALTMILGFLAGMLFAEVVQKVLKRYPHLRLHALPQRGAHSMLLIILVMTMHSFAEGVGIGVAFGNGVGYGFIIALALAIHNIPEGLAISLVLCPRGVSAWQAIGWSIFSSVPQMVAVPAFLFVEYFEPFLPVGLGFAAGAMVWMVWRDLFPDAVKEIGAPSTWRTVLISAVLMFLFEYYLTIKGW